MCTISSTIEFENTKEVYRSGEVITGLVALDINCTNYILLKALSLQFSGYAYTKWEKSAKVQRSGKPKPKTLVEYREDYVSTTSYLIGSEMANAKRFEPGTYNYNFMVNIPLNIPSTFDSPLGFIRYELTVHADYGDHIKTLCKVPIGIEEVKDLRLIDSALQLPAEKQQKEYKPFIKFWQQPLQLFISIPQNAYIVGECISLHIKLTNPAKLKLQTIISNLNRIATYKSLKGEMISDSTSEATTIASNIHNLYGRNLEQIQLLSEILIPQTPPTLALDACTCINLSYELEVLVTDQNKKRWVTATVPIVIGSVSLRSDAKMLPTEPNNQTVPVIRVAKSLADLTLPTAIDLQDNLSAMQTTNITTSIGSLASSLQEANFMTAVQLNKKSRHQIIGDLNSFKPRYLYYDLPDGLPRNLQSDFTSSKLDA